MAAFDTASIARITSASVIQSTPDEPLVTRVLYDSRKLTIPNGTLFVAIPGKHNNGHDHIPALYGKGVRSFLVSQHIELPGPGNVLLVSDSLRAIQALAAHNRNCFKGKVIGITGSNGKTVVKEWIFQALSRSMTLARSPRSYNSQLGVALSMLQIENYHELAVIEAGISQAGEMDRLEAMIRPDIGVFTTIGPAHDEFFSSREEKIAEKLILFKNAGVVIFPADDPSLASALESGLPQNVKRFSWGKMGNSLVVVLTKKEGNSTLVRVRFNGTEHEITVPFLDEASIENALSVFSVMLVLGCDPDIASANINQLHSIAMRLELKEGINGCSLINDSYSSDLMSLDIALDFLAQQDSQRERIVILSDILQSGMDSHELYSEVSRLLKAQRIHWVIGIGEGISSHRDLFGPNATFFLSTEDFLLHLPLGRFHNRIILLKGARAFSFERIVSRLQQKAHETVLRINLNALVHNLKHYQSLLSPGTLTMAMVKAFGYGSGTWEVASALQFHKVDYLAVAYADEGYELRKSGIELPIMVMNPDRESLIPSIRYAMQPEIYSMRILDELISGLERYSDLPLPVGVHIKLDTGMHRLGFLPDEVEALASKLVNNPDLRVVSVFTHLAASEDPDADEFTHLQARSFLNSCEILQKALGYAFLRHMLNSAGIGRFPEYHFDMVRLGIGLYGISSNLADQVFLENVSTLRSAISQLKQIPQGDTVGYNRQWRADAESRIAIIPVGYADGLDMRLGNGKGRVIIRGRYAPIVGKICMDMCMADVTGIAADEGDEVIIFGEGIGVADMAEQAGTIPYEILTGISSRVKRVYYYE